VFAARCHDAISSVRAGRELLEEAQRQPSGEVRLTVPFILGRLVARHLVPFTSRYPLLAVRVSTTDRLVRLIDENVDVAVRIGALEDSSLLARRLSDSRWVTVASPVYVARHGEPQQPAELSSLSCLQFVAPNGRPREWSFLDPRTQAAVSAKVKARLLIDQGEHLLEAAVAGMGVCQVLDFMVGDQLAQGRLVEVLADWAAPGPPIHALSTRERSRAPAVKALVGHLTEVFRRISAVNATD
jgi:DNA-binding transcriptional LysR family regulator